MFPQNRPKKALKEETYSRSWADISFTGDKKVRYTKLDELRAEIQEQLAERFPEQEAAISKALHDIEYNDMRSTTFTL